MPVKITVSQIREALYRADSAAREAGDGTPSTSMLGQWFHEVLGQLVQDGAAAGPLTELSDVDADLEIWKQTLVARAYTQFIGPQLTRQQAALQNITEQVLAFWEAVQAACHWLAELVWSLRTRQSKSRTPIQAPWQTLSDSIQTEESVTCLLREPGWTDSVQLVGIADAVVRLADSGIWCAIEFKLGKTSPAADLGQACLYHLILSSQAAGQHDLLRTQSKQTSADAGTLALISFHPQRSERLFSAAELTAARQRLIELIGVLANVNSSQIPSPTKGINQLVAKQPGATIDPPVISPKRAPTDAHRNLGRDIVKTLAEYKVHVTLDEAAIIVGAAFLRFPIELGRGTRVANVEKRAPEIQIRLGLRAEPFITRDDGKLVIDVQRPDVETIYFDSIRPQLTAAGTSVGGSRIPVGINLSGDLICADLAKSEHSHLLVAGTTGSGKSEWLRLAIAGLMITNTPDTLRLLIIDPKRNAFHALRNSPFLWRPIVFPDEHSAVDILMELAEEMDRRYRVAQGADSFAQMVTQSDAALPRIVCVCDEYRDLISRNREQRKGIEEQICRLGAKARAAGIHLILATQEPSRDTITGPLDSNIPARVGLKMGKSLESKMLLNQSGAEKLLGNGDLLFRDIGQPRRLQAPLLTPGNLAEIFGQK